MDGRIIAGYVMLGVGALLLVIAIIIAIVVLCKRKKRKKQKRQGSPDTFRVVYKVPEANGNLTTVTSHPTPRDQYAAPHSVVRENVVMVNQGIPIVRPQAVVTGTKAESVAAYSHRTLPMMTSHSHAQSRTQSVVSGGERTVMRLPPRGMSTHPPGSVVSAPVFFHEPAMSVDRSSTTPRPIKVRHVLPSTASADGKLVFPLPKGYKIKNGKVKSRRGANVPVYVDNAIGASLTTKNNINFHGSLPNLYQGAALSVYDDSRRPRHVVAADEIPRERRAHVDNWLRSGYLEESRSHNETLDDMHVASSSVPSELRDVDTVDYEPRALHLRWSPSMRRHLLAKESSEAMATRSHIGVTSQGPVAVTRSRALAYDTRSLPSNRILTSL